MSERHLLEMGVDPEHVETAVDFLDVYADVAVRHETEDPETRWASRVDAASALREAAQWALCFDPPRARDLLDRAGAIFRSLQHPFGAFLHVVSGSWFHQAPYEELGRQLQILQEITFPDREHRDEYGVPAAVATPLAHPQQQAYLMVAATAVPEIASEYSSVLRALITESPQRLGVVPVGSLGTPIRRYWRIASNLANVSADAAVGMMQELTVMAHSYAESLDLARTNEYTWRNAASPVDVGDIDIMGLTIVTARRLGLQAMRDLIAERMADEPFMVRAPLEMALEYVESMEQDDS